MRSLTLSEALLLHICVTLTHSDSHFPLNIPQEIQRHYNISQNQTDYSGVRLPRGSSSHILGVPEALRDHYREARRSRRGRQIVPAVYSCGHQGKDQFINLINPHYPSHDSVAGTCHFRMVTSDPGVCQVRVDFVDTELQSPVRGDCLDQYLVVSGSVWNPGFHKLCGINPDQHFYLHLDKSVGFQHIDFTITSVTPGVPYKFGLWISQVDCFEGSSIMAPGGCTQLYFGNDGVIKTFNFEGVQYLNNQDYRSCVRAESGACFMELRADTNHFMLEPVEAEDMEERRQQAARDSMGIFGMGIPTPRNRRRYGRPNAKAGDMYCAADYLLIPGGRDTLEAGLMSHSHDRYCGGALNPENDAEEGGSVYSRIQGDTWWLGLVTGRRRDNGTQFDQSLHGPGVRLRYSQHRHCVEQDILN